MADRLSRTFSTLSDPTRRAILRRLGRGECSVTQLAAPFDMSLPAISKHLRVLERSGLIEPRRQHRWRYYRLRAAPLREARDWLEDYRQFWQASLDRLGEYLQELQAPASPSPSPPAHDHRRSKP